MSFPITIYAVEEYLDSLNLSATVFLDKHVRFQLCLKEENKMYELKQEIKKIRIYNDLGNKVFDLPT